MWLTVRLSYDCHTGLLFDQSWHRALFNKETRKLITFQVSIILKITSMIAYQCISRTSWSEPLEMTKRIILTIFPRIKPGWYFGCTNPAHIMGSLCHKRSCIVGWKQKYGAIWLYSLDTCRWNISFPLCYQVR